MEEKTEVFDFQDKNSLFGHMSPLHDGNICALRKTEHSFFLHCNGLEGLCDPDGKPSFNGFSEAEVEYVDPKHVFIWLFDGHVHKEFTPEELFAFLKKRKSTLDMLEWLIESDGENLCLDCCENGGKYDQISIWIRSPKKIIYRWK